MKRQEQGRGENVKALAREDVVGGENWVCRIVGSLTVEGDHSVTVLVRLRHDRVRLASDFCLCLRHMIRFQYSRQLRGGKSK